MQCSVVVKNNSELERVALAACGLFGSLGATTAFAVVAQIARLGWLGEGARRTVDAEAVEALWVVLTGTTCDQASEIRCGAFEVGVVTPTSQARVRFHAILSGVEVTLDCGPGRGEYRVSSLVKGCPELNWVTDG